MRVVVVGAGVVGASIAYHAARRGAEVTVLDAADRPAAGATGASFGWIGDSGHWPGGAAAFRGRALTEWHRLEREHPGIRVRWTGALSWPAADGGERIDRAGILALEPHLREPPSTATFHRHDGAVDPVAVTHALLDGIRLELGTRVTAVADLGAEFGADVVVVAAGVGVTRLCPAVRVADSPAEIRRFPAAPGLVRTVIGAPGGDVRQEADGRLLATGDVSGLLRDAPTGGTREVGHRPVPPGGPVIGPVPGGPYVAVMHSGVTLAPLVGRLVAQEVVDGVEAPELAGCRNNPDGPSGPDGGKPMPDE